MWRRAVRWVYDVLPGDPEATPVREAEKGKGRKGREEDAAPAPTTSKVVTRADANDE
ncbi:MAG: hypothetical protein R2854_01195 [Caldilineaceae bacterium]